MSMRRLSFSGLVYGESYFVARPIFCDIIAVMCLGACVVALLCIGGVSFNRYFFICHNEFYSRIFGMRKNIALCGCFWVVAALVTSPTLLGWTDIIYDHKALECMWDRRLSPSFTIFFSSIVILTIIVILISYMRIFLFFRNSKRRVAVTNASNSSNNSTMRLARSLFCIFIAFVVCWSPYAVLMLSDFEDRCPQVVNLYIIMFAHMHSTLNPYIHVLTNLQFRQAFFLLIRRICCLNPEPVSSHLSTTLSTAGTPGEAGMQQLASKSQTKKSQHKDGDKNMPSTSRSSNAQRLKYPNENGDKNIQSNSVAPNAPTVKY